MINLVSSAIAGLIVGVLARWFYLGTVEMGFLMTILLGVGGSLLAGLVTNRGKPGFQRAGFIASIIGAMVLIWIGRELGWHI